MEIRFTCNNKLDDISPRLTPFRELSFVNIRNLQGLCNVPIVGKMMTTRETMINGILKMVVVAMTVKVKNDFI